MHKVELPVCRRLLMLFGIMGCRKTRNGQERNGTGSNYYMAIINIIVERLQLNYK